MERATLGYLLGTALEAMPVPIMNGIVTSLGRDDKSSIVLDDLAASRKHASVEGYEGGIFITDQGSSNGTFVDDRQIDPHEAVPLLNGSEVRIGGKVFYVVCSTSPTETQKVARSRAGEFSRKPTLGAGFNIKAEQARWRSEHAKPSGPAKPAPGIETTRRFSGITQGNKLPDPPWKAATPAAPMPPVAPAPPRHQAPAAQHSLSGKIGRGGLPQIIQMIHTKRFSGRMQVSGENVAATILFLNGDLYSATEGADVGVPVIYHCASLKQAEFSFESRDDKTIQKLSGDIKMPTMQILMECCKRMVEPPKR